MTFCRQTFLGGLKRHSLARRCMLSILSLLRQMASSLVEQKVDIWIQGNLDFFRLGFYFSGGAQAYCYIIGSYLFYEDGGCSTFSYVSYIFLMAISTFSSSGFFLPSLSLRSQLLIMRYLFLESPQGLNILMTSLSSRLTGDHLNILGLLSSSLLLCRMGRAIRCSSMDLYTGISLPFALLSYLLEEAVFSMMATFWVRCMSLPQRYFHLSTCRISLFDRHLMFVKEKGGRAFCFIAFSSRTVAYSASLAYQVVGYRYQVWPLQRTLFASFLWRIIACVALFIWRQQ